MKQYKMRIKVFNLEFTRTAEVTVYPIDEYGCMFQTAASLNGDKTARSFRYDWEFIVDFDTYHWLTEKINDCDDLKIEFAYLPGSLWVK